MTLYFIRDIAQIIFYATGSLVAWIGLQKWREELEGKVKYEAAKRALAKTYSIRDQIRMIQSGVIFASEWSEREPVGHETETHRQANNSFFVYQKRFQRLLNEVFEMYPVMVEAEAVFGEEAREKLDKLTAMTNRLWVAIVTYHQGLYEGGKNPQKLRKYRNIIHGINEFDHPNLGSDDQTTDDDHFKRDLDAAVQDIKEYFIPQLGRKPPVL